MHFGHSQAFSSLSRFPLFGKRKHGINRTKNRLISNTPQNLGVSVCLGALVICLYLNLTSSQIFFGTVHDLTLSDAVKCMSEQGCALDFFTNTELPEEHEARLSMDAYMSERNRARLPRGPKDNRNISNPCDKAREATKRNSETSAAVTIPSNELTTWDDRHVSVVREVIFGTLARLAWEALRSADEFSAARSQKAQESAAVVGARPRGTAGKEELRRPLLFNEQYVVKPPQSSIEFGWHTASGSW